MQAPDFKQYGEKIKDMWENFSLTQRMIIGVVAVATIAGFIALTVWINKTNYQPLYTNLSPEDAASVVGTLQKDNVPYELTNNGATILVPAEQVYDLRIQIAGEGNLVGQGIGFEIFDETKVGQTDFVQKINYMRALQGELARTLSAFPSVDTARIHLVMPQRSLFVEEQQEPSASVVLKLKDQARKPDAKEIQSIVNMMLMSVEGLNKAHLSITDSRGAVLFRPETDALTGISSTQMEHKLRVQRDLERRIDEMLSPVFGPGHVISKVNVDMDFSQKTIRREIFDPEQTAVRSEQRSEEQQKGQANLEAGAPDVNFRGDGITGSVSTQDGSRETRTTNYEINKEEQNIIANVGDVKRLTVAVIVDGTYQKVDNAWTFVPRSAEEITRIEQLVANAVGIDKARGDALEVSSVPFNDSTPPPDPNLAEIIVNYADRLGQPILNALLAFLFLMLVVRPVVLALIRPKVEAGEAVEGLEGLPSAEEQLALYEALEEAARAEEAGALEGREEDDDDDLMLFKDVESLRVNIFNLSEQHMDQVIVIMRGWIKDGERVRA